MVTVVLFLLFLQLRLDLLVQSPLSVSSWTAVLNGQPQSIPGGTGLEVMMVAYVTYRRQLGQKKKRKKHLVLRHSSKQAGRFRLSVPSLSTSHKAVRFRLQTCVITCNRGKHRVKRETASGCGCW